jgi:hypothetical protein
MIDVMLVQECFDNKNKAQTNKPNGRQNSEDLLRGCKLVAEVNTIS